MLRRDLLKLGTMSALAHLGPASSAVSLPEVTPGLADIGTAAIMKSFTAEEHRRRLLNIQACESGIRKCLRRDLVTGYIPGQVSYNLGEYPCRKPYDPDEYDERERDRLRDGGIRLIQVMEDWNDLLGLFGGDKFTATNPAGLRRFMVSFKVDQPLLEALVSYHRGMGALLASPPDKSAAEVAFRDALSAARRARDLAAQEFPHPIDPSHAEVGAIRDYSVGLVQSIERVLGAKETAFIH